MKLKLLALLFLLASPAYAATIGDDGSVSAGGGGSSFSGTMTGDLEMGNTPYSMDGGTSGLAFDPDNDNTNEVTINTSGNITTTGNLSLGSGTAATQILDIGYGHISFNKVTKPSAPSCALGSAGGITGNYKYVVSYVTALGETEVSAASGTCSPANQKVTVTIPTSSESIVTSRRIYRTLASGTTYTLLTTVADNTTTSYTDSTSDATIHGATPDRTNNSTGGLIYIDAQRAGFLGETNTFFGFSAGAFYTTGNTGDGNTAYGYSSLGNSRDGIQNTAIGYNAGSTVTNADYTAAFGDYALAALVVGNEQTAVGHAALRSTHTGTGGTAVGGHSLYSNDPPGGSITAFSDYSGTVAGTVRATSSSHDLKTGDSVSIVGTYNYDGTYTITIIDANSFYFTSPFYANETVGRWAINTLGQSNTAIGNYSGWGTTIGNYNTFLGYYAGANDPQTITLQTTPPALNYATSVGAAAQVGLSNSLVLGGTGSAAVNVGIGTIKPLSDLSFGGSAARTIDMQRNLTTNSDGNNLTISSGDATANGSISALNNTPTDGGTGYSYGDVLTITTGGSGATAVVSDQSGGVVTEVFLLKEGSGYTTGTGKVTSGGTGTGCTLNITTVRASTDKNGGNLILSSGTATGNGGSNIYLQTVGSNQGTGTTDRSPSNIMSIDSSGQTTVSGTVVVTRSTDIGWTVVTGTNTACNSTCTNACVAGMDAGATNNAFLSCTDTAADSCLCAGPN